MRRENSLLTVVMYNTKAFKKHTGWPPDKNPVKNRFYIKHCKNGRSIEKLQVKI